MIIAPCNAEFDNCKIGNDISSSYNLLLLLKKKKQKKEARLPIGLATYCIFKKFNKYNFCDLQDAIYYCQNLPFISAASVVMVVTSECRIWTIFAEY